MTNFAEYLVFLGLGKLLIFVVQTTGALVPVWALFRAFEARLRVLFAFWPSECNLVDEFRECGFCVGTWIFLFLALYARINIFEFLPSGLVAYFLTAVSSSFIVHLVSCGWRYQFGE